MLGVSHAFEEAIGGAQDRNSDFGTIDQRSEAFVMALAGFAEQHGFDGAGGAESLFNQAHAFDADETGFGRQSTAQPEAKFLQPAIVPAVDRGRSAGGPRAAGAFPRGPHIASPLPHFPALP